MVIGKTNLFKVLFLLWFAVVSCVVISQFGPAKVRAEYYSPDNGGDDGDGCFYYLFTSTDVTRGYVLPVNICKYESGDLLTKAWDGHNSWNPDFWEIEAGSSYICSNTSGYRADSDSLTDAWRNIRMDGSSGCVSISIDWTNGESHTAETEIGFRGYSPSSSELYVYSNASGTTYPENIVLAGTFITQGIQFKKTCYTGRVYVRSDSWMINKSYTFPGLTLRDIGWSVHDLTTGNPVYDGSSHAPNKGISTSPSAGVSIQYKHPWYSSYQYRSNMPSQTNAGTYTVEFMLTCENYNTTYGSFTWTIDPAEMVYSCSDKTVTYNGSCVNWPEINVRKPSSGYQIAYNWGSGGSYTTDLGNGPSDAGSYTLAFRISAANYKTVYSSVKLTINRANGSVTASVTNKTLTFPYEGSFTYSRVGDGPVTASVTSTGNSTGEVVAAVVAGNTVTITPKKVGTCIVKVTSGQGKNYNQASAAVSVTVIPGTIKASVGDKSVIYSGSAITPDYVTVTEPSTGATVKYGSSPGNYISDAPARQINAGTYTIYYRVTAPNYNDKTGSYRLTIKRKPVSVPKAITGLKYNKTEQTGVEEGEGYTISGNKNTNAGDYVAVAVLDPNYCWDNGSEYSTDDAEIHWSIAKISPELKASDQSVTYPGTLSVIYTTEGDGEVTGSSADDRIARVFSGSDGIKVIPVKAGKVLITLLQSETMNYLSESVSLYVTVEKGTLGVESEGYDLVYNRCWQAAGSVKVTARDPQGNNVPYLILYRDSENEEYAPDMPDYYNAGTYTVVYKVFADNYRDASGSFTVFIDKAPSRVTLSSNITVYNDGQEHIFSYESEGAGDITVTLSDNSLFSAFPLFIPGNEDAQGGTIRLSQVKTEGSTGVTLSMIETENYYASEASSMITVLPTESGKDNTDKDDTGKEESGKDDPGKGDSGNGGSGKDDTEKGDSGKGDHGKDSSPEDGEKKGSKEDGEGKENRGENENGENRGNGEDEGTENLESFALNHDYVELAVGDSITLSSQLLPANTRYGRVTWSAGDGVTLIPSLDGRSAVVRSERMGEYTVTATEESGAKASCRVRGIALYDFAKDGRLVTSSLEHRIRKANGKLYCFDSLGRAEAGFVTVDNATYYFDTDSGEAVRGLQEINGSRYYFDKKTCIMVTDNKVRIKGDTYHFGSDGRTVGGVYFLPDKRSSRAWFCFDDEARMHSGVFWAALSEEGASGSCGLYFFRKGKLFVPRKEGFITVDGGRYYLYADGHAATGEVELPDNKGGRATYCFDRDTGRLFTGALLSGNRLLPLDRDGQLVTSISKPGLTRVGSDYYWYEKGSDGTIEVITGWKDTVGSYYFDPVTGASSSGIRTIEGKDYVFVKGSCVRKGGIVTVNRKRYAVRNDGTGHRGYPVVQYGLTEINGKTYYADEKTGVLRTGLITISVNTMSLSSDSLSSNCFYASKSGVLQKEKWVKIDDQLFRTDAHGSLRTGRVIIEGRAYYLNPLSKPAGAMKTGLVEEDGGTFLYGAKGTPLSGSRLVNFKGRRYYIDKDGRVLGIKEGHIRVSDSGKGEMIYELDTDGSLLNGTRLSGEGKLYLYKNGIRVTGSKNQGDDGSVSWKTVNKKKYLLSANAVYTGAYTDVNGSRMFFKEDGSMASNELAEVPNGEVSEVMIPDAEGRHWRFFNRKGILVTRGMTKKGTGWYKVGKKAAYIYEGGNAASGWCNIGGNIYWFDPQTGLTNESVSSVYRLFAGFR